MIELPPMTIPVASQSAGMGIEGRFLTREITTSAGTRKYKIYIPSRYDSAQSYPLVVMLHGCTQDADNIARGTRLNDLAEDRNVLVAYPEQPVSANLMKCWNWYEPGNQKRDTGEPSIIAELTRAILQEYSIDHLRIYVGGVSAGAAMALAVAYAYPELYTAVGTHSGIALGAATSIVEGMGAMQRGAPPATQLPQIAKSLMGARGRFIPAIVFQGGSDRVVNSANARNIVDQHIGTHSNPAAMELSCEVKGTSEGGYHFTRAIYGKGDTVVEAWVVDELGHAWSGGSNAGTFTDAKGPDAMREMLRFFLDHRMSAAPSR